MLRNDSNDKNPLKNPHEEEKTSFFAFFNSKYYIRYLSGNTCGTVDSSQWYSNRLKWNKFC